MKHLTPEELQSLVFTPDWVREHLSEYDVLTELRILYQRRTELQLLLLEEPEPILAAKIERFEYTFLRRLVEAGNKVFHRQLPVIESYARDALPAILTQLRDDLGIAADEWTRFLYKNYRDMPALHYSRYIGQRAASVKPIYPFGPDFSLNAGSSNLSLALAFYTDRNWLRSMRYAYHTAIAIAHGWHTRSPHEVDMVRHEEEEFGLCTIYRQKIFFESLKHRRWFTIDDLRALWTKMPELPIGHEAFFSWEESADDGSYQQFTQAIAVHSGVATGQSLSQP